MAYIWIYTALAGHPWSLFVGFVVLFGRRIISLLWQIVLSFRRDVEEKEEKDLGSDVPDRFSVEGEREGRWTGRPLQVQKMTVRYQDLVTEFHDCNELISHVHEGVVDSEEENVDRGFCMGVGSSEVSLENVSETIANAGAVMELYKAHHRNGGLEESAEDKREEGKTDPGFSMGAGAADVSLENVSETIANAGAVIELYKAHHRGGGLGVDQTIEEDHVGPDEDASISGGDEDTGISGVGDVMRLNHEDTSISGVGIVPGSNHEDTSISGVGIVLSSNHEDTSISGVGIVLSSNHEDTSISGVGIVLGSNDEDKSMSGIGDMLGSNEIRSELESFLNDDVSEDPCPEMFSSISHTEEQGGNLQSHIHDSVEDGDGVTSFEDRDGDVSVQDVSRETNGDALQTEPDTHDQEGKMPRISNKEEHQVRISDEEDTTSIGYGDALVQDKGFETNRDAVLGLDDCKNIHEKTSPGTSGNGEQHESEHVDVQLHRDFHEEKYEATEDGNTSAFYEYDDYDDEDHDFFIEKLKSEIKRLKGSNLSVIPEESESDLFDSSSWDSESEEFIGANLSEDYSPSFRMLEPEEQESIEDFYEKYKDRMRHFDKLNYHHINTLGLLHMDQEARKFSKPQGVTKILRKSLSNKFQTMDESEDMRSRLEQGLETVYVGQTCLSWEALHWQYKMFKRMVLSGPEHDFFYDYVADQFQQFHVLLQRFLENEEFEGPRVLNYANNRSVSKSLLYVPPLKGSIKEEEEPGTGISMVTASQLVSMMEGCIVLFSEFVKADKRRSTMPSQLLLNFLCANQVLEDPNDSTLLHSVRKQLHSKELQVKELQRRGRCIIKRVDPTTGEGLKILMALVDIKLVSRVLKMSRITTDQLQWCQKKLKKLNVTDRRVLHRDSSPVLFPI